MVTDPLVSAHADFCNDCFMLPDPRTSKPDENQSGSPSIDLMVELYQMQKVEDETKDLQLRLQNSPLTDDFQNPSYCLSNCRTLSLLPRHSLDVLFIMVNKRLIPEFWLSVLRGECPSPLIRQSILHLRQIMMMNLALHRSRTSLSKTEWYFATGHELFYQVEPTSCYDDCGIFRQPLNEIDEQGVPVKTQCNHIFHMQCIREWINISPNGDCPACRATIQGTLEPVHDTSVQGPHPEWLVSLLPPAPQVDPNIAILIAQELVQLEANVEDARLRAMETDQNLTDLEDELQVPREDFSSTENLSNEYIRNASETAMMNLTGLSAVNFIRYRNQVRLHQISLTQFATSSQRLGDRKREVERFRDHVQRRYRTTILELVRAEVDFLVGIIDYSLE
ncbi:hypothetical protein EAE96_004303 [Botrytis aclada]|nr:hypothetical protein EAE96_004303 [Botrytis aclada]